MAKICEITGKHTRTGFNVSHAHNRTKRRFYPNLQTKKLYLAERDLWITLRVAASVLRTINKKGLLPVLKEAYKKNTLASELRGIVASL